MFAITIKDKSCLAHIKIQDLIKRFIFLIRCMHAVFWLHHPLVACPFDNSSAIAEGLSSCTKCMPFPISFIVRSFTVFENHVIRSCLMIPPGRAVNRSIGKEHSDRNASIFFMALNVSFSLPTTGSSFGQTYTGYRDRIVGNIFWYSLCASLEIPRYTEAGSNLLTNTFNPMIRNFPIRGVLKSLNPSWNFRGKNPREM